MQGEFVVAWKNLTLRSLADAMVVAHKALEERDEAHALIDGSRIEAVYRTWYQ